MIKIMFHFKICELVLLLIWFLIMNNEQTHPLHVTDKKIIDSLITKDTPEEFDLINLARLINRYDDFPGEIDLKKDIEKILKFWNITRDNLQSMTKKLWSNNFKPKNTSKDLVGSGFDTTN